MSNYIVVIAVPGLQRNHISSDNTPHIFNLGDQGHIGRLQPVFPAVTCTVQASLLSGKYPNQHGIISNGLYDRETHTVSFWEQASNLVQAERIWDIAARKGLNLKTAVIFWQNTMYARSNIVLTPRPLHMEDHMLMWCYSRPPLMYEDMSNKIGKFDLTSYWGPLASQASSKWIERATSYIMEHEKPNVIFTYLPHLDYIFQRHGIAPINLKHEISFVDELVGSMVKKTTDMGIREKSQFILLSEYGFTEVSGDIPLNRILREKGFIKVREIEGKEFFDFEYSNAFAMVDHQIAHIYVKDGAVREVKRALDEVRGIEVVMDDEGQKAMKVNHTRSGDLIVVSEKDKWFSYYWWLDEDKSPPFANRVDIHRKPGYDPSELFLDSDTHMIPLNGKLVRASHGRLPSGDLDDGFGIYVSDKNNIPMGRDDIVNAVTIGKYLGNIIG